MEENVKIQTQGDLMANHPKKKKRGFFKSSLLFVWEISKVVIISLAIIVPVRYFLIQPFFVNGASMEPQFHDGEYLIVDELSYRLTDPERGEVIIFKYPKDPSQYYIKRIIGLPGEKIKINQEKITIFNSENPGGFILDESDYLLDGKERDFSMETKLSDGEYFVMGDNRHASSDSRTWGSLPENFIVGRAWIRAWPFDKIDIFEKPEY
jgi:signal peptidase I